MRKLKWYSLVIATTVLVSCQNSVTKEPANNLNLIDGLSSVGMFRGFDMGDLPKEIIANERANLLVETDSVLEYDFSCIYGDSIYPTRIYYSFDEFGLFEIQVDISTTNDGLKAELAKKLSAHFGESSKWGNQQAWTTNSPSNRLVEIVLFEDAEFSGTEFLSLNFLERLESEL